jgi:hypothetical protein
MIRKLLGLSSAILAFGLTVFPADAGWGGHTDKRLTVASIGAGAATTAAFFAFNDWNWKWNSNRNGITALGAGVLTTVGCGALSPIVATAVINRPLTYREAHVLIGDCIIPIIGGWLVNEAYKKGILWAPDEQFSNPLRAGSVHRRVLVTSLRR